MFSACYGNGTHRSIRLAFIKIYESVQCTYTKMCESDNNVYRIFGVELKNISECFMKTQ